MRNVGKSRNLGTEYSVCVVPETIYSCQFDPGMLFENLYECLEASDELLKVCASS
jgi:hypothetical protein